MTAQTGSW